MVKRKRGVIVNLSSLSAVGPSNNWEKKSILTLCY
jgi:hypothetical protein